jgi:hypothetical protein
MCVAPIDNSTSHLCKWHHTSLFPFHDLCSSIFLELHSRGWGAKLLISDEVLHQKQQTQVIRVVWIITVMLLSQMLNNTGTNKLAVLYYLMKSISRDSATPSATGGTGTNRPEFSMLL